MCNLTDHALSVVSILKESAKKKNEKLTMAKLVELMRKKRGVFSSAIANDKRMSAFHCERLLVRMLLDDVLAEYHTHSAYSTNSYLKCGYKATMVEKNMMKVELAIEEDSAPEIRKKKRSSREGVEDDEPKAKKRRTETPKGTKEKKENERGNLKKLRRKVRIVEDEVLEVMPSPIILDESLTRPSTRSGRTSSIALPPEVQEIDSLESVSDVDDFQLFQGLSSSPSMRKSAPLIIDSDSD